MNIDDQARQLSARGYREMLKSREWVNVGGCSSVRKLISDIAIGFWVVAGVFFLAGTIGYRGRYSTKWSSPDPTLLDWLPYLVCVGVVLSTLFFLFKSRLLWDRNSKRLLRYSRFGWWRKLGFIANEDEILSVTTTGPRRFNRFWGRGSFIRDHQVVAMILHSGDLPLSNWTDAEAANTLGAGLAAEFGCPHHACPVERSSSRAVPQWVGLLFLILFVFACACVFRWAYGVWPFSASAWS